jgi:hypothetical protein
MPAVGGGVSSSSGMRLLRDCVVGGGMDCCVQSQNADVQQVACKDNEKECLM